MRASTAFLLTVATTAISSASVSITVSAADTVPCTADSWEALNAAAVAAGVSDHRCWYLPYVTHWTSAPCEANAACISFFSTIVDKIPDCWYGSVSAKTAIEDAIEVCTGTTNTTSSTSSSSQQTESPSASTESGSSTNTNTSATDTVPCTADSWEALNAAAVAAGVSERRCWYLPYVTHWTSAPCEANSACISFFSTIVDKIPDCWYGSVSAKTAIEDAIEVCTGTTITTSSTSSSSQQTEPASTAGDSTTAGSDNTPTTATSNSTASDASTDTTNSAGSSSLRSTTSASAANGDSNAAGSGATVSFSVAALLVASQLALAL